MASKQTSNRYSRYKNPLFEEELQLDLAVFQNLNPSALASWDEVELWCAMNGTEPNEDVFKFLLIGMNLYANIYELVFKALETSCSLDKFVNKIETVETLYKLTDREFLDWSVVTDWLKVFGSISNDTNSEVYKIMTALEQEDPLEFKYRLFSAIDKRFPILLVQFYEKHKRVLYQHDDEFIRYLFKRMKMKAAYSSMFKAIYKLMCKERDASLRTSMFLR